MPELPEVELAARNLRAWLGGKRVAAARVPASRVLRGASAKELERMLTGRAVEEVERRGKWMALRLSGGAALFSHLGMTGKWVRREREDGPEPHERARIDVAGASVRYRDPRMFGRIVAAPDGADISEWSGLGPDPLRDGLTARQLGAVLDGGRRSVKELLLDQERIAGLGNIQAQEALFRAKIDPRRPAGSLDAAEVRALARAITASIEHTLAQESGPEITYVEEPGSDNPFLVYAREDERCPRCHGATIKRIVQGGRATFYCPRCQR